MDFDLGPPPSGIDLTDNDQAKLYAAYILTYGLACAGVALRYICRLKMSRAGLGLDDYLITGSLVTATGMFISMILWITHGIGKHIWTVGVPGYVYFLHTLFGIELFYTLSIMLTKFSILAFYWRVFGRQNIRLPIFILTPITSLWGVGITLTIIFQCRPIKSFWDVYIHQECGVNTDKFFIGQSVPNILTDWTLLIVPIPLIWRLRQSLGQKIALTIIFILGGFICVISIIRLAVMLSAYRHSSVDLTWVFIGPSTWTAVEINIGILSACLPSLRPISHVLINALPISWNNPGEAVSPPRPFGYSNRISGRFYGLGPPNQNKRATQRQPDQLDISDTHLNAINVETTISIKTTRDESSIESHC